MKDFDDQKTDAPTDAASPISKSRGQTPARARDAGHVASEIASHSHPDADALRSPELSHPANAAPLGDLLGQLQHSHGNIYVQRVVADMNEAKSGPQSHAINSGQCLEAGVRTEMESALGENFGDVRVHSDANADRLNVELGARAVTQGRDIYFGAGEYNPGTREGKELLAHELTHVVQQSGSAGEARAKSVGQAGDSYEQEADRAASAILSGQGAHVKERAAAPSHQLQGRGPTPRPRSPSIVEIHLGKADPASGSFEHGVSYSYSNRLDYDPRTNSYFLQLQMPREMAVSVDSEHGAAFAHTHTSGSIVTMSIRASGGLPGRVTWIRVRFTDPGGVDFSVRFFFPRRPLVPSGDERLQGQGTIRPPGVKR